MKLVTTIFAWFITVITATAQLVPPDEVYGELFREVQLRRIFPDGKTFVDCIPKRDPAAIMSDYNAQKLDSLDLKAFVEQNFILPPIVASNYQSDTTETVSKHITNLWQVLRRPPDSSIAGSSLIPLPYPYIVPGGRFREIYYWDSYFTMLGLQESGQYDMIDNMVKNFAYLISTVGHIPNGNRTYYIGRSQPPFFSVMLDILAEKSGNQVYAIYLSALEKEYDYWMDKSAKTQHVVKMPDGSILNRYFDQLDIPRQESYREDVELAKTSGRKKEIVYRHLRSAAESGWDFSSRWFTDGKKLQTISVTNYVPVDLNCLLYHLELTLALAQKETGNLIRERYYSQLAERRKKTINKYLWSSANGYYVDYDLLRKTPSTSLHLGGMYALFFSVASDARAASVATVLESRFLQAGGLTTTLKNTGEQWDAPNGWAPLQWMAIQGLENYQKSELAKKIAKRWIKLNTDVYKRTGKLMEKYNVVNLSTEAGGGEYPSQDGFGWTNGVLLKLIGMYGE